MPWLLVVLGLVVCLASMFLLMGLGARGASPDPFFPAADAQVLLRQIPGEGRAPSYGGTPIYDA